MSELPVAGDLLDVWYTAKYGTVVSTVLRTYRMLLAFGGSLPTYEDHAATLVAVHDLRLTPVMGDGDYDMSVEVNVYRDGSLLENYSSGDIPMSISGQGPRLPPACCPISSFRPNPTSPRVVSRLYWPCASSNLVGTDTRLSLTGWATVQAQAETFLGIQDWGGSGYAIRTRSTIRHKGTLDWLYLATADTLWNVGTQRRRNKGPQKAQWG